MYRGAEPAGRRRLGVVGVRQQQQHLVIIWVRAVVGPRQLRRQEETAGQRLDRADERDRAVRLRLHPRLPGLHPGLQRQRLRRRGAAVRQQRDRSGRLRQAAGSGEGRARQGAAAVRFTRLGSARGVRPDRGDLQRRRGEHVEPRRAHHREDLQRRHHQVERPGHQGAQRRRQTARRRRSTWFSATTSPARPTTSRSISMPPPTAPGAKAPTRRSTAASARARPVTKARRRRCGPPTGRSPTTNGRSRSATS